eukprot:GEMP01031399.1.p1 GENE.GEMP01031399.1~~GEMP01031399.1.p1  ORF type:complete len:313 (+),score=103.39 GEMP01031399.1:61-999(+)
MLAAYEQLRTEMRAYRDRCEAAEAATHNIEKEFAELKGIARRHATENKALQAQVESAHRACSAKLHDMEQELTEKDAELSAQREHEEARVEEGIGRSKAAASVMWALQKSMRHRWHVNKEALLTDAHAGTRECEVQLVSCKQQLADAQTALQMVLTQNEENARERERCDIEAENRRNATLMTLGEKIREAEGVASEARTAETALLTENHALRRRIDELEKQDAVVSQLQEEFIRMKASFQAKMLAAKESYTTQIASHRKEIMQYVQYIAQLPPESRIYVPAGRKTWFGDAPNIPRIRTPMMYAAYDRRGFGR